MRDKFIPGAGTTYAPGDTGGAVDHTHDFTGDGHDHTLTGIEVTLSGTDLDNKTSNDPIIGTTGNGSSLPEYHSLAYTMYIGG